VASASWYVSWKVICFIWSMVLTCTSIKAIIIIIMRIDVSAPKFV
jgi:hypothetical protein